MGDWKSGEGVTGPNRMTSTAKVHLRSSLISKLSAFSHANMSQLDLPRPTNRTIRQLVDLALWSGALVVKDAAVLVESRKKIDEDEGVAIYTPADDIKCYADMREKIDTYMMRKVLFDLSCSIVPDPAEWYALLFDEDHATSSSSSGQSREQNEGGKRSGGGKSSGKSSSGKRQQEQVGRREGKGGKERRRERVKSESDMLLDLLDEHDQEYLARVEARARQEQHDSSNGTTTEKTVVAEEKGFFARLFGI